jgi:hypothetical protein
VEQDSVHGSHAGMKWQDDKENGKHLGSLCQVGKRFPCIKCVGEGGVFTVQLDLWHFFLRGVLIIEPTFVRRAKLT